MLNKHQKLNTGLRWSEDKEKQKNSKITSSGEQAA